MTLFATDVDSHQHSLQTLEMLQEYDEFMESIRTVVDLGCGSGLDLEWWATRETREDVPKPLNIRCTGVDQFTDFPMAKKYLNIVYQQADFEDRVHTSDKEKYDVLWCHDALQYAINPIQTLSKWWDIASEGAMLAVMIPQTTNIHRHQLAFNQESYSYYHHSIVSLIHMLSVSGWDCKSGFFLKQAHNPWLSAIVYKSSIEPMDPRKTSWHEISEKGLLPESAERSVLAHDDLWQQDLVLPWLDQSLSDLGQQ